jgi:alcohol dehydrogenase class IV
VTHLVADMGFQTGLKNYGVSPFDIPGLVKKAIDPAKKLRDNNPRVASVGDVEKLFERAM